MEDNNFDMSMFTTPNNFKYSAIETDSLKADGYTIVNILVDTTGSVWGMEKDIEGCIKKIVDSCRKHPRAEQLLIRVAYFDGDNGIREAHGFTLISSTPVDYKIIIGGMTPLIDATLDCVETIEGHSKTLEAQEFSSNGVYFVITDGGENDSRIKDPTKILDTLKRIRKEEICATIKGFLIGLNDSGGTDVELQDFKEKAGFEEYISINNVTPGALAKLAQWVSQSISSTSQALNSGGPSQSIDFNL